MRWFSADSTKQYFTKLKSLIFRIRLNTTTDIARNGIESYAKYVSDIRMTTVRGQNPALIAEHDFLETRTIHNCVVLVPFCLKSLLFCVTLQWKPGYRNLVKMPSWNIGREDFFVSCTVPILNLSLFKYFKYFFNIHSSFFFTLKQTNVTNPCTFWICMHKNLTKDSNEFAEQLFFYLRDCSTDYHLV